MESNQPEDDGSIFVLMFIMGLILTFGGMIYSVTNDNFGIMMCAVMGLGALLAGIGNYGMSDRGM